MAFLIKAIQFSAALSIIVGIHELGHLLFAKLFKIQVKKYMIGFPPKIFKFKWGETEYSLGSIPLGGAVQLAGMIDETLDTDHLNHTPAPWEFRSKPAWQQCLTMLGGIIFNLLSGILIWIILTHKMGYTYLPKDAVNKYGIIPNKVGCQIGFKAKDKIIKINGKDFDDFNDILSPNLFLSGQSYYTVERAGELFNLPIPEEALKSISDIKNGLLLRPIYPCLVQAVRPNKIASQAGLIAGDQIIELAGQPIFDQIELRSMLKTFLGQTIELAYLRDDIKISTQIQVNSEGLGVELAQPYNYKTIHYSFIASIPIGLSKALRLMETQFLNTWKLITGKLSLKQSLTGPVGIFQTFPDEFIGYTFWLMVSSLSIALAFMNLLPIPALDGGHTLRILYEGVSGRKVSDKFIKNTQILGMILILLLTLCTLSNDIRKLL